jgi:nicotinamidase-related amidase
LSRFFSAETINDSREIFEPRPARLPLRAITERRPAEEARCAGRRRAPTLATAPVGTTEDIAAGCLRGGLCRAFSGALLSFRRLEGISDVSRRFSSTLALAMALARCAPPRAAFSSATIQKRARVSSPARRTTVAMAAGSSPEKTAPRLDPARATLFVCDVQEKFAPVIHGFDNCVYVASAMLRASELLEFPALVTEQVPDKLGKTVDALQPLLAERKDVLVVGKTKFSMCTEGAAAFLEARETLAPPQALLVGLEAHVCVAQTAFDLLDRGWEVFVLVDGVSSIRVGDRAAALRRMEQSGCALTTSEAALFEMIGDATHLKFRDVSKLVREPRPETPLPSV